MTNLKIESKYLKICLDLCYMYASQMLNLIQSN